MPAASRAPLPPRSAAWRLGLAVCLLGGCQLPSALRNPIPDVTPLREERREEAITEFEQRRNEAQYQAAIGRRAAGDLEGCRRELSALVERDPNHVGGRLLLAQVLLEAHQLESATAHVEHVLELEPDNATAQRLAAELSELVSTTTGEHPEHVADPTGSTAAAYEQDPERSAMRGRTGSNDLAEGSKLLELGQVERAKAAFDRAVETAPNDPQIVISVAVASLRSGQTALARDYLEAACLHHPEEARLFEILGLVYYRRGEYEAAQVSLHQALSLDNTRGAAYFLLGSTLAKSGDSSAAQRHFREAARRDRRFSAPR